MNNKSSKFLVPLLLIPSLHTLASEDLEKIYLLANDVTDVVTHSKDYPSDGHFKLTTTESDIVASVGKLDYDISAFGTDAKNDKIEKGSDKKEDCLEDMAKAKRLVAEAYDKRKYTIAAVSLFNQAEFDANVRRNYAYSSYNSYMSANGISTAQTQYNFKNILSRSDIKEETDTEKKFKKIEEYLKSTSKLDVPMGVIVSEYLYYELLANPDNWREALKESSQHLSFDEKIRLASKFGGDFGNDYNYGRANETKDAGGVIPIETLLKNLKTSDSGGVCRDVALAQAQMLSAMGVKDAYTLAYASNRGGHATVVAVDPDDPSRVYKMNYGELYEENGKKGTDALDQNNSLPNAGMQYRVYDSNGKPVASVPTSIGNILRNATGTNDLSMEAGKNYSINKISFDTPKGKATLFNGTTSTGETLSGVAYNATYNDTYLEGNTAIGVYKGTSDKLYHDMDMTGFYMNNSMGVKTKVYETKIGEFSAGLGASAEFLINNVQSTKKDTGETFKETVSDRNLGVYGKINYGLDLNDTNRFDLEVKAKGRYDKKNIADEGSYDLVYDSTRVTAKYSVDLDEEIRASTTVATTFGRYGGSIYTKSNLETPYGTGFISGNAAMSTNTPKFFEGQTNAIGVGYESNPKSDWIFRVEYNRDLDNSSDVYKATVEKRF